MYEYRVIIKAVSEENARGFLDRRLGTHFGVEVAAAHSAKAGEMIVTLRSKSSIHDILSSWLADGQRRAPFEYGTLLYFREVTEAPSLF